jgi:hypothetical protein
MGYSYAQIELATCALRVLFIALVVAFVAFAVKSRAVFVAGTIGSLLGFVVPQATAHISGTPEGVYLAYLAGSANHVLLWGIAGATVACVGALFVRSRFWRTRFQYSLRTLLIIVTVASLIGALVRLLMLLPNR